MDCPDEEWNGAGLVVGEEYKRVGDMIYAKYVEIEKIMNSLKKNNWKLK